MIEVQNDRIRFAAIDARMADKMVENEILQYQSLIAIPLPSFGDIFVAIREIMLPPIRDMALLADRMTQRERRILPIE